jgi:serine/threonine-protein kinase
MQDAGSAPVSFGKYLLDAELARGGMSRVWQARLRGPGGFEKQLVVKQILPQLAQDPSFIELLVHEANTLVRMSHPNIVPVYELGIVDGVYFLAMERVRGVTVAELLRAGPLPPALVAELGTQVSEALRYAHERFELVHRDVTPRNVMVDADGHVRLLDFGIAAPSARTGRGELFGSPGYMSPEQAARTTLTPASDLFGLGALLFEALTGRRAVVAGTATRLEGEADETDAELAALIDALLATDPTARGSAGSTASRLRSWLTRKQPEGAREQLGRRVDALARAASAADQVGAAAGASVERDGSGAVRSGSGYAEATATERVTRSIAASVTLTEMLTQGSTEPLPTAGARPSQLNRAVGWTLALTASLLAVALGAWLTRAPREASASSDHREARAEPAVDTAVAASAPTIATPPRAAGGGAAGSVAARAEPEPEPDPAPTPSNEAPAGGSDVGSAPAEAAATLTVHATPWAEARLDGRELGTTPLRGQRARAGTHVLTLDCAPLGRKARVTLQLRAGTRTQVIADMQADPPKVKVR